MKMILAALLLSFTASTASAQTWVEFREHVTQDAITPRVQGWISGQFDGSKVGTFVWFQADEFYAESYIGLSLTPIAWLQFGVGVGVEQAENPARFGSFMWVGAKKQTVLGILEHGGSGHWHKVEYNFTATKILGVGFTTESYKGTGPRVEVNLPETPLMIWASPLIHDGKLNGFLGFRLKM